MFIQLKSCFSWLLLKPYIYFSTLADNLNEWYYTSTLKKFFSFIISYRYSFPFLIFFQQWIPHEPLKLLHFLHFRKNQIVYISQKTAQKKQGVTLALPNIQYRLLNIHFLHKSLLRELVTCFQVKIISALKILLSEIITIYIRYKTDACTHIPVSWRIYVFI